MKKFAGLFTAITILTSTALSQTRDLTGRIIEQNGEPVPFATVNIKDTKNSVAANSDGAFYIKGKTGDILVITAVNFEPKEFTVSAESYSNFVLTRTSNALPDVAVTTAFGIKREQRITPYSTQVITSDAINIIPQTNLNDALVGKIAGVQFRSQSEAKLNSQTFARVRGGLLLSGDAAPI